MDDKRRVDAAVAVTSQTDMEAEGAVVWRRKGPAGQAWKETKRMLRIGFTDRPSRYDFTHSFDPANPEGKK